MYGCHKKKCFHSSLQSCRVHIYRMARRVSRRHGLRGTDNRKKAHVKDQQVPFPRLSQPKHPDRIPTGTASLREPGYPTPPFLSRAAYIHRSSAVPHGVSPSMHSHDAMDSKRPDQTILARQRCSGTTSLGFLHDERQTNKPGWVSIRRRGKKNTGKRITALVCVNWESKPLKRPGKKNQLFA